MVGSFCYQTFAIDAAALEMQPASPLDQLLRCAFARARVCTRTPQRAVSLLVYLCTDAGRLRSQCESQAKHQALYSRRDPCWIEFADAQKARVKAEAAYKALSPTPPAKKTRALKEWYVRASHCHTALISVPIV
jgi:hypothetical protein